MIEKLATTFSGSAAAAEGEGKGGTQQGEAKGAGHARTPFRQCGGGAAWRGSR